MIRFKEIEVAETKKVAEKYICDRCGKEVIAEKDIFELQEWHFIRFTGGYNSAFGDMSEISCDICDSCLKILIGDFCRYEGEGE